jgi:O-antigen ligase
MLRDAQWARVGLVLALILVFAGIVLDSLFSASRALDDTLLAAAAAVILLLLLGTRVAGSPSGGSGGGR